MDKLKPILTHKFWILAGVALLLPVIGWYMGTGKVAAEIDTRVGVINGLSVPAGNQIPNEDWMKKAQVVQDERQERLDTAADYLWNAQQEYMTWPPNMQAFVQDKKFEDDLTIEGEEAYRASYNVERENLLKIVDPLRWNEMAMKEEGRVAADPSALATLPLDDSVWPTAPPSSKEVWYLQEEMWLIRGLLEAVRDVNDKAGADSIVKAPIKQIDLVQLQGGDMAALAAMAEGAGAEGDPAMSAEGGPDMATMMGMMRGGAGDGEGAAGAGSLDFDLAEEVGPNTPSVDALAEGGAEGDVAAEETSAPDFSGMMGMMGGGEGMGGAAATLLTEKRYVDDDAAAPFKTRAFKMQVVMDHRKLPEFLAELTNSPFPVRILRVHWAEMNSDPRFAGGGSYGGGEGAMPTGGRGMGAMGSRGAGMGAMGGRGAAMGGGYSPPGLGSGGRGMGAMGGRGAGMGGYAPPGMGAGSRGMGAMGGRGAGMGGYAPPGMGAGSRGMGAMGSRGMGAVGGRGMMGSGMRPGLPGMGAGEVEGGFGGETGQVDLYSQAMSSPYLAQVVVGGLMTIYRSPQEMAAAATEGSGEAAAEGTEETPAEGTAETPAEGTEPVPAEGDPATEGTAPADAAAPSDAAAAPADGTPPPGDGSAPADGTAPADTTTPAETTPAPDATAPPDDDSAPAASAPDPAASSSEQPATSQP